MGKYTGVDSKGKWIVRYQVCSIIIGKRLDCGCDGKNIGVNKRWRD